MQYYSLAFCLAAVSAVALGPASADAQRAPRSKAARIAEAMSAAPVSIARNATIKDWPKSDGGEMAVLREGSNGWVCLPTPPQLPGREPMCIDSQWEKWLAAYMAKTTPEITATGYSYMLNARSQGSNTDPYATKKTADNEWHMVGPHVMVLHADPKMYESISTDHHSGGPYVMFKGTPYAHVMWPIR
ncbi:MAG: hypothetical protein ACR2G6_05860 [Gemmatimonadaceae bacterium]